MKSLRRIFFYIVIAVQIFWWSKVVFTNDLTKKPHDLGNFESHLKRVAEGGLTGMKGPITINTLQHVLNIVKSQNNNNKESLADIYDIEKFYNNTNLTKMQEETILGTYYSPMLHHTILPRNCAIILEKQYMKNPTTICSQHKDLDLLIVVHTAPYHFSRRSFIRQKIANNNINPPYTVQSVFFIGVMPEGKRDISKELILEKEYYEHGDLVQMSFNEDFRNLSLKAVSWLRWTNEHCRNPVMILKIDDDVVIDTFKIVPLSRAIFSKYSRSIFCNVNRLGFQPIPRRGRTQVDQREFFKFKTYPYVYCSGFIVFLTPDILPLMLNTVQRIPFYNVDDVFMFGMVPKLTGNVTFHNIGYNVSIWHQKVFNCIFTSGTNCRYFGSMAEEDQDRDRLWQIMAKGHKDDFHFPTLRV